MTQVKTIEHHIFDCCDYIRERNRLESELHQIEVEFTLKNILGGGSFDYNKQMIILQLFYNYVKSTKRFWQILNVVLFVLTTNIFISLSISLRIFVTPYAYWNSHSRGSLLSISQPQLHVDFWHSLYWTHSVQFLWDAKWLHMEVYVCDGGLNPGRENVERMNYSACTQARLVQLLVGIVPVPFICRVPYIFVFSIMLQLQPKLDH